MVEYSFSFLFDKLFPFRIVSEFALSTQFLVALTSEKELFPATDVVIATLCHPYFHLEIGDDDDEEFAFTCG